MKKWRGCLLTLMVVILMAVCAPIVLAAEEGKTENGLKWSYDKGVMAIIGYDGYAREISIPERINGKTVSMIRHDAFAHQEGIERISLPHSLTEIGDNAFSDCTSLKRINIPDAVKDIGFGAFAGCESMADVRLSSSLRTIAPYAFQDCYSLVTITIPDSVTEIKEGAFYGCKNLLVIKMPDSLKSIGEKAFYNCSSLQSVSISQAVIVISPQAFMGCNKLTLVFIPETVLEIGDLAIGYYRDYATRITKVPGFAISGYKGTAAEKYANENGFIFRAVPGSTSVITGEENLENRGVEPSPEPAPEPTTTPTTPTKTAEPTPTTPTLTQEPITIAKAPSGVKATAKKEKVTVTWKKIRKTQKTKALRAQIKSIQVQYATDANFTQNVGTKTVGKNKTKAVLKLGRKTVYYVRVRYVGADGVSAWSKVKRTKTK